MFVFLPKFYTEKSRVYGTMATELTLITKTETSASTLQIVPPLTRVIRCL